MHVKASLRPFIRCAVDPAPLRPCLGLGSAGGVSADHLTSRPAADVPPPQDTAAMDINCRGVAGRLFASAGIAPKAPTVVTVPTQAGRCCGRFRGLGQLL
jgi:hypothetical protein